MFKNLTDEQLDEEIDDLGKNFLDGRDYYNEDVLDLLLEIKRLREQIKEIS